MTTFVRVFLSVSLTFTNGMSLDIASWLRITLSNVFSRYYEQHTSKSEHLLDGKLCIAAAAVLLDAVEHEVASGVVVQLPGLLLQILHGPLDVSQPRVDLPLVGV